MRLHRLTMTAFGPFPDTVEVDFDALSAAGLFLLSGDNGAGKTTVLDAICFALFGAVPGERQTAKSLRSDLAAPAVVPRVSLEATLAGRRFRLERSPAWDRPKKRGSGLTRQQPTALISEWTEGAWRTLSTRADETGQLVSDLLGMNLTQFVQIALLPQGKFDAFLRSSADDRQRLLQKLFHTGRFQRVEGWFRDRRVQLHRAAEEQQGVVVRLLSRLAEAAETPLPQEWAPLPAELIEARLWLEDLADRLAAAERAAVVDHATAAQTSVEADTALEDSRALAARQRRHQAAVAERARLEADRTEVTAAETRLVRHQRAAQVAPLLELADLAAVELREAVHRLDELVATAGPCESHDRAARDAGSLAARLRAALPREAELTEQVRLAEAAREQCRGLEGTRPGLVDDIADADRALAAARLRLEGATAASTRLPEAIRHRDEAATAVASAREVLTLRGQLTSAQEQAALLRERRNQAHEYWLHLRELRLTGIAAELAGQLAVGAGCPVCGSEDHPHPAALTSTVVDDRTEAAAQKAYDDAAGAEVPADHRVHELRTQVALLEQASGGRDLDELEAVHAQCVAEHDRLAVTADDHAAAAAALRDAEARLAAAQVSLRQLDVDHATRTQAATIASERAAELRNALAALSPDGRPLTALVVEAETAEELHRSAQAAVDAAQRARTTQESASERLAAAATRQGFADDTEARSALLPDHEAADLARRLAAHTERVAATGRDLADPELVAAAAEAVPDLTTLEAAARSGREQLAGARVAAERATRARTRVAELAAEVTEALGRLEPLRREWQEVAALAAFVEGKSSDNRWQMRLSAYVLAYRLSQVVAAANLRLSGMSDARYALVHSGAKGAGDVRGGLSLRVRDDWSGELRDPATLSGGETFVVSLALALGLADVISQEAGGSQLETLFVDEGFGSLDAETLDHVLDTLDTLRDGGRVVGVVSHVPEMKDRITTHLHVEKSRTGSVIR